MNEDCPSQRGCSTEGNVAILTTGKWLTLKKQWCRAWLGAYRSHICRLCWLLDQAVIENGKSIATSIRGWIVRGQIPFIITSSLVLWLCQLCAFTQLLKCSWTVGLFGWLREEAELGLLGEHPCVLRAAAWENDGGGNVPCAALALFFVPFSHWCSKERNLCRVRSGRSQMIRQLSLPQAVFTQKEVERGTGALILAAIPPVPATRQSSWK